MSREPARVPQQVLPRVQGETEDSYRMRLRALRVGADIPKPVVNPQLYEKETGANIIKQEFFPEPLVVLASGFLMDARLDETGCLVLKLSFSKDAPPKIKESAVRNHSAVRLVTGGDF